MMVVLIGEHELSVAAVAHTLTLSLIREREPEGRPFGQLSASDGAEGFRGSRSEGNKDGYGI